MVSRDAQTLTDIPTSEYRRRRAAVLKALKGAAAVVLAGEGTPPLLGKWRPDVHFLYITGIEAEPGAAVLFDPAAEDPDRRVTLLLRPLDPERDRWDGYRPLIGNALREQSGFARVMRSNLLPVVLTAAARRSKRLACLHPFATYAAPVSPDLALFQQVGQRVPGVAIEDRTNLLPQMRSIKSPLELRLMRKAIAATAAGYQAMLGAIRPGGSEAELAAVLEQTYRAHGATGLAYNSIVAGGANGTVLHYMDNNAPLADGDLIVIDSGAEHQGYAADVTRTYPVSGRFTAEQRHVYTTVLRAQQAAIKACRPGAFMHEVDAAARKVIDAAGFGDAFIHGIGHQLGLEVHDVTPDGPLVPGMVVTIEPGIYLPDRKLGVRIEDDILITSKGNQNLTAQIPKTVPDVEAAIRAAK